MRRRITESERRSDQDFSAAVRVLAAFLVGDVSSWPAAEVSVNAR
jgi:hypothetical protein